MRDYAMVRPSFWIGETGRHLRAAGPEVLLVAQYLMTCPSSNMIGLYHLSLPTLAHDTGVAIEGARKALRRTSEGDFAHYSEAEEVVWVVEMARYQIAEQLSPRDNRIKAISRELDLYRKSSFFPHFMARYAAVFHLPNTSPFEAPSKPLRSQEQEQEQEQETDLRSKGSGNSEDKHIGEGLGGDILRLPPKTGTQIEMAKAKARAAKKPSESAPRLRWALPLPPWLPPKAWADWDEFRAKKSGKGWTQRAAELSLRTLEKLREQGHDPVAVIEESIQRSYTGLFPLKGEVAGPAPTKELRYYSQEDPAPPRRDTTITSGPRAVGAVLDGLFTEDR